MKLLITGATGLVGTRLVEYCLSLGHQVHFLSTRPNQLNSIQGAKGFLWNPLEGTIDSDSFTGVDTIINLAGSSISKPWSNKNRKLILESRIKSLQTLYKGIQLIENHSIKSLLTASAIGIYKEDYNNKLKEKNTVIADDFLGSVVSAWEREANMFSDIGLDPIIVRIGLVLSSKGGVLPSLLSPIKAKVGVVFGNGDQWQSWIHIDDLVQIILFLAQSNKKGVYNAVAPNPVRQKEFVRSIAKALKKKIILFRMPKLIVNLVFGERSGLLINSHCISASKIKKTDYQYSYPTLDQALDHIVS